MDVAVARSALLKTTRDLALSVKAVVDRDVRRPTHSGSLGDIKVTRSNLEAHRERGSRVDEPSIVEIAHRGVLGWDGGSMA